tara:strand:+ start:104 stop:211 length:108 start_codon:yes stop_codon:yes gene_type:complete
MEDNTLRKMADLWEEALPYLLIIAISVIVWIIFVP